MYGTFNEKCIVVSTNIFIFRFFWCLFCASFYLFQECTICVKNDQHVVLPYNNVKTTEEIARDYVTKNKYRSNTGRIISDVESLFKGTFFFFPSKIII